MKRYVGFLVFMSCLLLPPGLFAADNNPDGEPSRMQITLNEYRAEGYDVLGPVQYLGKSDGKIKLFRHNPVSYMGLDMVDETGSRIYVREYEFVYLLSKDRHVVLIRVDREVRDNV